MAKGACDVWRLRSQSRACFLDTQLLAHKARQFTREHRTSPLAGPFVCNETIKRGHLTILHTFVVTVVTAPTELVLRLRQVERYTTARALPKRGLAKSFKTKSASVGG
jgi:hypothetical protein